MATNANKKGGRNQATAAQEQPKGGVKPSPDEQAKHEKHVEAGKKGGQVIKKEAEKNKK